MLATDGVLRHVEDDQIRDILLQISSLKAACVTLIEAANDDGGDDNSTCVLVRMSNGAPGMADPETPPPS
jgi:PPM family protein phosphatase